MTKLLDYVVGLLRMLIRLIFATLPCVVCRWGCPPFFFSFCVNKKWLEGVFNVAFLLGRDYSSTLTTFELKSHTTIANELSKQLVSGV